jgi:hypothetical protein
MQDSCPRINEARNGFPPIGRLVAVPVLGDGGQEGERLDGRGKDPLGEMAVSFRHAKIGMAGELLDGTHRDSPHG